MKNIYQFLIAGMVIVGLAGSSPSFGTDLTPRAWASADQNYIHTLIPQTNTGDAGAMIESIQYFDGLGRQQQTVSWQASPALQDIVTPVTYDVFGREDKKYLPYATTAAGNGAYKSNAVDATYSTSCDHYNFYNTWTNSVVNDTKPFALTEFEASPLNRVLKQGAPGLAWQPNTDPTIDHSVKLGYGTNSTADAVMLWTIDTNGTPTSTTTYPVNTLYKTTTWDENNDQTSGSASHTEEFKDMQGKVVLKRSFNGTVALSTYYVYDDMELLRFVLPPKAMEDNVITGTELDDLCYQYRYDERKRMTMKKIPGAESILLVYDNRDRLVMSQDGTSRAAGKWMFTKYDCLNRPAITGYVSTSQSADQLRTAFKNYTGTMYETAQSSGNIGYTLSDSYLAGLTIDETNILSITYYDNYVLLGVNGFSPVVYNSSYDIDTYTDNDGTNDGYFDNVKGKVTGTKMKVLDGNEFNSSARWLYSASYYDDRYRVIQQRRTLYDGSTGGVETLASKYDFTGRVSQTEQAQTFNGTTTTVDKYLTYDQAGRLSKTEQEITGDSNGRVTVAENVYNEIGQLIDKKLHKAGSYDHLQNVDYAYNIRGWLASINNPDNLSGDLFGERLLYETPESGLTGSTDVQFNGNISGMVWNSDQKSKQGYRFTYDGINRLTLGDYKYYSGGWNDNNNYEEKSLAYDLNGNINRLQRTDNSGGYSADFTYAYSGNQLSNINSGTSYTYDQNGNTTLDGLRGMAIGYNVLNLPNSITKSSDNISYIYSANGEKLAKKDKYNLYQYYAGSMVYNNDKSLNYILFEEGVVNKSSVAFTYEYHLKDHLGNTRVAFHPNGGGTTTTQVAEYYPFGSSYLPISPDGTNKYLYNGKEKQDDVLGNTALDEYDYGARFYDPMIGRWHVLDPKSERYYRWSPYTYALNNPVGLVDPNGEEVINADEAKKKQAEEARKAAEAKRNEAASKSKTGGNGKKDFANKSDYKAYKEARGNLNKAVRAYNRAESNFEHTQQSIDNFKTKEPDKFAIVNNLTYTNSAGEVKGVDIVVNTADAAVFGGGKTGIAKPDGQGNIPGNKIFTTIGANVGITSNVLPHEFGHGVSIANDPIGYFNLMLKDPNHNCQDPANRNGEMSKTAVDWQEDYDRVNK